MELKVLDVTLRDGGFRNNFHFSKQDVTNILTALDKAGVDYIEIGYRNGIHKKLEDIGQSGSCTCDYLSLCNTLLPHSEIVVMAFPNNITQEDILELKEHGVNMVRLCITKDNLKTALNITDLLKHTGIRVSLNLVSISQYSDEEVEKTLSTALSYNPDVIYFADSTGTLTPERVSLLYSKFIPRFPFAFGFHAHDNIGLAQANAIAALNAGVKYIDFSLGGMGKGIGNLRAEFFVAYLHAMGLKKYNLAEIVKAANYVRKNFNTENATLDVKDFNQGIFDYLAS